MKLLTTNHKLEKCRAYGYEAYGLQLLPHTLAGQKKSLCPKSTPGCRKVCLVTSGRGRMSYVNEARHMRTKIFLEHPKLFRETLTKELDRLFLKCPINLAIRLNVFSDIDWPKVAPWIFEEHPSIQFYDYTKVPSRLDGPLPSNYHLTFSRSEKNWWGEGGCLAQLSRGNNVTVVVRDEQVKNEHLIAGYGDWKCVDGDLHDLIFLHPTPRIVLLTAKGKARKDTTGFVVD